MKLALSSAIMMLVSALAFGQGGMMPGPGVKAYSAGTWSVVQHPLNDACTGTSCAVTVASTGTNHAMTAMIAVATNTGDPTPTFSSMSGGGTWTEDTSCRTNQVVSGTAKITLMCATTTASTSGATTITTNITESGTVIAFAVAIVEWAWTGSTRTVDTASSGSITSPCTSCTGVALTLTGTSDVIHQFIFPIAGCSSIAGGAGYTAYTADFPGGGNIGSAGAMNTTTGTAPTWTCTSGQAVTAAVAIKGS